MDYYVPGFIHYDYVAPPGRSAKDAQPSSSRANLSSLPDSVLLIKQKLTRQR
jgi:hypothetical protein